MINFHSKILHHEQAPQKNILDAKVSISNFKEELDIKLAIYVTSGISLQLYQELKFFEKNSRNPRIQRTLGPYLL